ncbi:MAG: hypothetical protein ABIJ56_15275 [Pseudomonadota bacterium]
MAFVIEGLIDRIERKVKENVPDVKQIFVEAGSLSGNPRCGSRRL